MKAQKLKEHQSTKAAPRTQAAPGKENIQAAAQAS
jgi:hypothetical protein